MFIRIAYLSQYSGKCNINVRGEIINKPGQAFLQDCTTNTQISLHIHEVWSVFAGLSVGRQESKASSDGQWSEYSLGVHAIL